MDLFLSIENRTGLVLNSVNFQFAGGHFQSHTYSTLASFVDKFGPRMTGTEALENSIDYMVKESREFQLNVWTENITAPKWER